MNQRVWKRTEDDTDHPLTSSPMVLERRTTRWIGAPRRGVVVGLGIAKDAYDEVMACFGAAVACGDDFARSAIRFRRKLVRRLASMPAVEAGACAAKAA